MRHRSTHTTAAAFTLALTSAACGRTFDPDKSGCFEMNDSAFQNDVTAGGSAAQAAALGIIGRNAITLVPVDGGYGGYVLEDTSAADYYFFLSRDVPLEVLVNGSTTSVPLSGTVRPFTACAGIAVRYTVPLAALRYVLKLGPVAEAGVVTLASTYDVESVDGGSSHHDD